MTRTNSLRASKFQHYITQHTSRHVGKKYTCTIDRSESSPSSVEVRTGTPITGKAVIAATMPKQGEKHINAHLAFTEF